MKRKMLVLFGVLLVGLAVIFLAVQARGASAQNMTFDEILNAPQGGQNAATQTGAELLTSTATAFPDRMSYRPARGSDPNLVPISLEQVKQNEAVIESAKILIEKADKKYVTAGWLHTVSQEYLRSDLGMGAHVLSDGSPAPADEWKDDTWTLLDEKGQTIQYVSFQDFGPTTALQVGTSKDRILGMEVPTATPQEIPNEVHMDSGFLQDVEWRKNIATYEMRDDAINNEAVVVYTIAARDVKPVEIGNRWVTQSYANYYFSKETGLLLQLELYDILLDGQTQLTQRITMILVEQVAEPPAEVLKYLE